jgi:hypothetical protein
MNNLAAEPARQRTLQDILVNQQEIQQLVAKYYHVFEVLRSIPGLDFEDLQMAYECYQVSLIASGPTAPIWFGSPSAIQPAYGQLWPLGSPLPAAAPPAGPPTATAPAPLTQ